MKFNKKLEKAIIEEINMLDCSYKEAYDEYMFHKNNGILLPEDLGYKFEEAMSIYEKRKGVYADLTEYRTRYKQVMLLENAENKTREEIKAIELAKDELSELECKLFYDYCNKKKTPRAERQKNSIIAGLTVPLVLISIITLSSGTHDCVVDAKTDNLVINQAKEEEEDIVSFEDKKEESKNTNSTGVVKDESLAKKIFSEFVNTEDMPEAFKLQLSEQDIETVLKMCNGNLVLKRQAGETAEEYQGRVYTAINETANDINSYVNSTSFKQFKTDLIYKPAAVFFEEGTLERKAVEDADKIMEQIYKDIKNNDVESFRKNSIKWGEYVRDLAIYTDSTGEVASIWQMDSPDAYFVLQAITSYYYPSIMEYSTAVNLATPKGETFGICIPFCYDDNGNLVELPLSELIYNINETPMNDLAKKAGHLEEWQNNNDSIMVQLGMNAMNYYGCFNNLESVKSKQLIK